MNRALVLAALLSACGGPNLPPPRIIVLVSVDTLRADHLGAYGYERPVSPSLDRLASRGVLFEDVTSPSPWTLPAHGSLLTGRYPSRHGLKSHERYLPSSIPTLAALLGRAGYETAAVVNSHNLGPRFGLDRGFQKFLYVEEQVDRRAPTTEIVDRGVDWLRDADARLFLFLHTYDVHSDYASLAEHEEAFLRPYDGAADGTTSQLMAFREGEAELGPEDARRLVDLYDAGIHQLDRELSRLLSYLDEAGLWGETLFVLTSDHGEEFFEHGGVLHGRTQFQEVVRVPLVLAGAGLPEGIRIAAPVSLVDVAPTLLALAGVAPPGEVDGRNLAPLWRDEGAELPERFLFGEADHNNEAPDVTRAVRWGPFKLRYHRLTRDAVLHDLRSDPNELRDVSGSNEGTLRRLTEALEAFSATGVEAPAITLSPEEVERLRSLGYVR